MDITKVLPADCINLIISLTSPRDACRSSVVSHAFQSAADSDSVWETFLPSDYLQIISTSTPDSSSPSSSDDQLSSSSKKQIFFHICRNPVLLNNGTMSFSLDKASGKKQYMVGARGLSITWGDTPSYWKWKSVPESRFSEVAVLKHVWWFEVNGKIESKILSPNTTYAAYLVYKFGSSKWGFEFGNYRNGFRGAVEVSVNFEGIEVEEKRNVFLDPPENISHAPRDRGDGWMEVEMGKIFNESGDDGSVVFSVKELNAKVKSGLVIEGIELRPEDAR